ncbi:MAG: hypothetical protein ACI9K2_005979 [Myxococcota bacterium]
MIHLVLLLACGSPDGGGKRGGSNTAQPAVDLDGDGHAALVDGGWDCDDADPAVHPDADELCNGIDDDCDLLIDGDDPTHLPESGTAYWEFDRDGDGFGAGIASYACEPPAGAAVGPHDCDDNDPMVNPRMSETCRAGDDDCDGLADEADPDLPLGQLRPWFEDADGDGWGDADGAVVDACNPPEGFAVLTGDCDDGNATVSPDGHDACVDGLDQDCDGHEPNAWGIQVTNAFTAPYVLLPEDLSESSFTIEMWVHLPVVVLPAPLLSYDHLQVWFVGGRLELLFEDGSFEVDDTPAAIRGALHHVAIAWDDPADTMRVFVDSVERIAERSSQILPLEPRLFFGRSTEVEGAQDVIITQARLRVGSIPIEGAPLEPYLSATADTLGLWHLDGGVGSVVGDESGNGLHMVVDGSAWVEGPFCPADDG